VKRREFIILLGGGAAAWPLAARAQQAAMPVVGVLFAQSPGTDAQLVDAFRGGLAETGYVEGRNLAIEYRWAEGRYDRLPELAADLVSRKVSVIAAPATAAAVAAKAATSSIPIVFNAAEDPVKLGLVASLARPGGNATGINNFLYELVAKRLGVLREMVPAATRIAVLRNPASTTTSSTLSDLENAARALGVHIRVYEASNRQEIDAAFAALVRDGSEALYIVSDPVYNARRAQFSALALRHGLPAASGSRTYAEAGGLMSYGTSLTDMHRQVGVYSGRILNGAKPADMPVVQSTKFELVINLTTARAIGLDIPAGLLAIADEVIE
jgi:ABC-type uncharacterized transport system substrate-binding protein